MKPPMGLEREDKAECRGSLSGNHMVRDKTPRQGCLWTAPITTDGHFQGLGTLRQC